MNFVEEVTLSASSQQIRPESGWLFQPIAVGRRGLHTIVSVPETAKRFVMISTASVRRCVHMD